MTDPLMYRGKNAIIIKLKVKVSGKCRTAGIDALLFGAHRRADGTEVCRPPPLNLQLASVAKNIFVGGLEKSHLT